MKISLNMLLIMVLLCTSKVLGSNEIKLDDADKKQWTLYAPGRFGVMKKYLDAKNIIVGTRYLTNAFNQPGLSDKVLWGIVMYVVDLQPQGVDFEQLLRAMANRAKRQPEMDMYMVEHVLEHLYVKQYDVVQKIIRELEPKTDKGSKLMLEVLKKFRNEHQTTREWLGRKFENVGRKVWWK